MNSRLPKWAGFVLAGAILCLAVYGLIHGLANMRIADIERAVRDMPAGKLWACGALTGISFLALGGYDSIAVLVVAARKVSLSRAWFAGAVANAISNTIGFHALTATAVRYRILTRSGLTKSEIAGITALSWSALAFGFTTMFSLAMLASPAVGLWHRTVGLGLLGILLLCALWLRTPRQLALKGYVLNLPSGYVPPAQMLLGALEMASAIGGLYILMPDSAATPFPTFSIFYIGAVLLGIASHAPGGLGVFEATMLTLSNGQSRAGVLAALLLYRVIYNIFPFLLAVTALASEEIRAAISSRRDSTG